MDEDEVMEVDDSREAENRLREERRGRDDRDRRDVFPSGPRAGRPSYYEDWQGARPEPRYNDGRSYGYGGGQGGNGAPRERYPNGPRYGRGGGQNWRP